MNCLQRFHIMAILENPSKDDLSDSGGTEVFEKFLIVVHLEEDRSERDFKQNGQNPASTKKVL